MLKFPHWAYLTTENTASVNEYLWFIFNDPMLHPKENMPLGILLHQEQSSIKKNDSKDIEASSHRALPQNFSMHPQNQLN